MVMASTTDQAEATHVGPRRQEHDIPLGEVLGEAEAKYGPMPGCIRSLLLLPMAVQTETPPESGAELSPECSLSRSTTAPSKSNITVSMKSSHDGIGEKEEVAGVNDNEEENKKTEDVTMEYHPTPDGINEDENPGHDEDGGEGCISLDDIKLLPSSMNTEDFDNDSKDDCQVGHTGTVDDILLDLETDHGESDHARRSPDSGCSMSVVTSIEDRISIASTVSSSSDDLGSSTLDKQILRLKEAMTELREKDVDLARQLLVVYDYVEETKWFLENFELCDTRRSMACSMSPSERRFSQNMHKRMSDYGMTTVRGIGGVGGSPHFSLPRKPAWFELHTKSVPNAGRKRHSRNISDGSLEQLKQIYHENNNNIAGIHDSANDISYQETTQGGESSSVTTGTGVKRPHWLQRRSISSSALEVGLSTMLEVDIAFQTDLMTPITDPGKSSHAPVGKEQQAELTLPSPSPSLREGESGDDHRTSNREETINFVVARSEQCDGSNEVTPQENYITDDTMTQEIDDSDHHGEPSSASSLLYKSHISSSSTDLTNDNEIPASSDKVTPNNLPLTPTTHPSDPADDCDIYVVDDDDDDDVCTPYTEVISPFSNWLQEQDETLL